MALGTSTFTRIESSSGTSASAALSHTPASGNTIVVAATSFWASGSDPTNLLAVSGSVNGAYTVVGRIRTGPSAAADSIGGLFYHTNVAASAETVTITGGTGTNGVVGLLVELTGYTTQTVDVAGTTTASGTGTSVTSTALTNSQADAIYVHAIATASGNNPATITPTSSFTSLTSEKNGASFPVIDQDSLTVASTASRTGSATIDSTRWVSIMAAFSDTPGGGGNTISSVAPTLGGVSVAATLTESFILNPVAPTLAGVSVAATMVESITGTAAVILAGPSTAATLVENFVISSAAVTLAGLSTAATLSANGTSNFSAAVTLPGVATAVTLNEALLAITMTSAVALRGVSVAATVIDAQAHLGQFPDCFVAATAGSIPCYATHVAGSVPCYGTHSVTIPPDFTP